MKISLYPLPGPTQAQIEIRTDAEADRSPSKTRRYQLAAVRVRCQAPGDRPPTHVV